MSGVGDRVRQVRDGELGWTQKELARRAKISQSSVSELETHPRRGSKHIVKIALALGVSPYWLDSGKGRKQLAEFEKVFPTLSESEQDAVLDYVKFLKARRAA